MSFIVTAIAANEAFEKTALANLRVELEQARITLERGRISLARRKELLATRIMSPEEYETAEAEFRINERKLEWAEARVEQGAANLRAAGTRVVAARALHEGSQRRIDNARAVFTRLG